MKRYMGHVISYILLIFLCIIIVTQNICARNLDVIDKDGFYIVDGVLEKYTGEIIEGKEIVLPQEVKTIGYGAFSVYNYVKKKKLIPEEFKKCFMKLTIPKDIKLEEGAFANCISLDIYYGEGIKKLDSSSSISTENDIYCKVHLPDSVRKLEEHALYNGFVPGCNNVRVYLNNGIKKIGDNALCGTITDYELPQSLETIGDYAFSGSLFVDKNVEYAEVMHEPYNMLKNESVKFPVLPKGLKTIGNGAFSKSYLPKADFIEIPASVSYIGHAAFGNNWNKDCYYLYKVDKKNKVYSSDKKGWLYSKNKKTLYRAIIKKKKTFIPKTVKNIELLSLQRVGKENSECIVYLPKKLEGISLYPGNGMYNYTLYFRGKKAPSLIKYRGDDVIYYRTNKMLYGNNAYISVPKSSKPEYIKKLKLTKADKKNKVLTH